MTVPFDSIPNTRIPGVYTEFDNRAAQNGLNQQNYRVLVIGQKMTTGVMPFQVPVQVLGKAQATELAGQGSFLEHMLHAFIEVNSFTELHALAVNATGNPQHQKNLQFSGTATSAGTIFLYVAGILVQVPVSAGESAATIGDRVRVEINRNKNLLFIAEGTGSLVILTSNQHGFIGNQLDVRLNYYSTQEKLPAGITATISIRTTATGFPPLSEAIANLGDTQYHFIVFPYSEPAALNELNFELASRWEPTRQIEGHVISAKRGTVGELITLGNALNSKHISIFGLEPLPTPPFEIAAMAAGLIALSAVADPARPLQSLELRPALPAGEQDQFTRLEREQLLASGISTLRTIAGTLQMERVLTTYKTGPAGAPDPSYLDINILLILSYLRFDFNTYFLNKYPRHKLGNDGTRYSPGQPIMTPKLGKAEALSRFKLWEEAAIVEDFEQFKRDLVVERHATDPNRLDFHMFPNLVNGLRIVANKISFLL